LFGTDSSASNVYTLDAATVAVASGGEVRSNIRASGAVSLSSALAKYNVQASSLTLDSATIQGDVKLTSSNSTSTISGTIQGNLLSAGNIVVTSGTLCSSGSKFLKALTLNMDGGSLGANTNIHLTSTSTSVNNYIRATSLNNVRVEKGNLTTIHGATVNGTLFVGGSLTFASAAPSAAKGLFANNSTQSLGSGSFGNINGPVHLPSYTGAPVFADGTGELWAPLVSSLTVTGSVGGKLRSTYVTIHPLHRRTEPTQ
jgi:filamentous hemagglutinin